MEIKQMRDLTVISIDENRYLGIACDSCGGVGYKEFDTVKASPQLTAYQTGKVVLAELMSMGFTPIVLADGLAVEMNDTGKQLIEGFQEVISKVKTADIHLTGSTEENIKTIQTSMGVTCVGICEKHKLKYKKTCKNHVCMLLGIPLVGNDVVNNPDKILDIDDYEQLYLSDLIKEIVPIGSRGTAAELEDLSKYNHLDFKFKDNISVNLKNSGGPSCCCLITIEEKDTEKIKDLISKPIEMLGYFC
ncbi:MAG: AIR synthase related protein [Sedimentibacter sp.]